jgi:hypothetical protein
MQDFASALDWLSASARQSYLARLDEGLTADRRWLQTLLPARFLPKASVLTDDGWQSLDTHQIATLLRARPDSAEKTRVSGRLQKLSVPVTAACRQHDAAIEADLKNLRTRELQQVIAAWTARKRVIEAESEALAQVFRNRGVARARVGNQSMAAARRGLVEADERRAALILQMVKTRLRLTGAQIAGAIQSRPREDLHACLRFVAPEVG